MFNPTKKTSKTTPAIFIPSESVSCPIGHIRQLSLTLKEYKTKEINLYLIKDGSFTQKNYNFISTAGYLIHKFFIAPIYFIRGATRMFCKLNADVFKESVFEGSEYSAIILGGDAETHIPVVTKDFGEIEKIITANSLFSEKNQGVPISYTAVFLKENAIAAINSSAEYVTTTYTEYRKGSIKLDHSGGYIAKFNITWRELKYENGTEKYTDCKWEKNDNKLTAPFSTVIPLPANATHIHVKATEKTGLVWEPWRTIVDEDIPLAPEVKVSIWGTTLNQKGKVEVNH